MPDGTIYIRFKPVDAFSTPSYMERLCEEYIKEIAKEEIEPLVLIAAFILDFLCIHPFIKLDKYKNIKRGMMEELLT